MNRVIAYLKVQEKSFLGARSSIFVSLLFPVMMTFVFGSIMPPDYLKGVVPGLIGFSILTYSLFSITSMSAKYRLLNIFKELSLTPLTKSEWLFSIVLWNFLIGGLSFVIVTLIAHFAFNVTITLNILIIPYLVMAVALFVAIGIIIGTVAKTIETASLVGNAVGIPMMLLTGVFFPVTMLPGYLQTGIHVLPLYYFVEGMSDLMILGDMGGAIVNMTVLGALAVAFFVAAVALFKWRSA